MWVCEGKIEKTFYDDANKERFMMNKERFMMNKERLLINKVRLLENNRWLWGSNLGY